MTIIPGKLDCYELKHILLHNTYYNIIIQTFNNISKKIFDISNFSFTTFFYISTSIVHDRNIIDVNV